MLRLDPFRKPDLPSLRFRVLSLGAGVQSTAMALMAAHGEITPMPDVAIFADTHWEPDDVYRHLEWLSSENVLPFPVRRVSDGNIRDKLIRFGRGTDASVSVPLYTESADGERGQIRRGCTDKLKIRPILRLSRELAGIEKGARVKTGEPVVENWMGISTDEKQRVKTSMEAWKVNRYPLMEKGMSRADCLAWIKRNEYPEPPKSACIGCPYKSNARWRELKENDPAAFADAVAVDESIRNGGGEKIDSELFLHRSCVPLSEVALTTDETGQPDFFHDECDGMCGV